MIETVVKSPLLPSTIHFNHTMENHIEGRERTEVMRITRDGVWVNPEISIDDTVKSVLASLDSQIKVLIKSAVEEQREWVGLTKEEVNSWELPDCPTVFEFVQFIEDKIKDRNT